MPHAVTRPFTPFEAAGGRLVVHMVPDASDNLVWLAQCRATGETAIIDGPTAGPALDYAAAHGLDLKAVFNTHTHGDHIGVNHDLAGRGLLDRFRVVGPAKVAHAVPGITEPVDEGDRVRIGEVEGYVMLTEGHIDGHVSYVFDGVVFCGDTLFAGGCGYLFDGPPSTMFRSLTRLAALDGDTRVCCAHEYTQDNLRFAWSVEPDNEALGERIRSVWAIRAEGGCTVPSTIEEERATNPFLRTGSPTLKRHVGATGTPAEVFAATRALKDTKSYRARGDSDLPLSDPSA